MPSFEVFQIDMTIQAEISAKCMGPRRGPYLKLRKCSKQSEPLLWTSRGPNPERLMMSWCRMIPMPSRNGWSKGSVQCHGLYPECEQEAAFPTRENNQGDIATGNMSWEHTNNREIPPMMRDHQGQQGPGTTLVPPWATLGHLGTWAPGAGTSWDAVGSPWHRSRSPAWGVAYCMTHHLKTDYIR